MVDLRGGMGGCRPLPLVVEHDRALDAMGGRMPAEHVGRLVCNLNHLKYTFHLISVSQCHALQLINIALLSALAGTRRIDSIACLTMESLSYDGARAFTTISWRYISYVCTVGRQAVDQALQTLHVKAGEDDGRCGAHDPGRLLFSAQKSKTPP